MEFAERQYFRQWYIWLMVGLFAVGSVFAMIYQLYLGEEFGNNPMSDSGLIVTGVLSILFAVFFMTMHLDTRINNEGVSVRMFPFAIKNKTYAWKDIRYAYIRAYHPISEYGGWGIRGISSDRALNVSGKTGLQLVMHNGKRLLIGTREGEGIEKVLVQLDKHMPEK